MRYEEHYPEHLRRRDFERYGNERPQQQQNFHDARSRWGEPATPHDLYRNRQPEQEGRFRTEGRFHQQRGNQEYYHPNPNYGHQNQGDYYEEQQYNRPPHWEQHQNRAGMQQAPDRWQELNREQDYDNEQRRSYPPDEYWYGHNF